MEKVGADLDDTWKSMKPYFITCMLHGSITNLIAMTNQFLRSIARVNIPRTNLISVTYHKIKIAKQRLKELMLIVEHVHIISLGDMNFYFLHSRSMDLK